MLNKVVACDKRLAMKTRGKSRTKWKGRSTYKPPSLTPQTGAIVLQTNI